MSAEPVSPVLHMSEEEFLERFADERPSYEFVNGEVTQKPMTKRSHAFLVEEVLYHLAVYRRAGLRGARSGPEATVNLSRGPDRRYRVPDIAFWAPGKPQSEGEIFLPPTLAVEVLSPGQTMAQLRAKCREYRERGVDVCWLIDPDRRRVELFDADYDGAPLPAGGVLQSRHLPGFTLPLADLFAALD